MKKELQVKEGFDTVKTFRRIKTKISLEMKDLTPEQIMARLAAASKEFEVKFGDNRVEIIEEREEIYVYTLCSLISTLFNKVISARNSNFIHCALYSLL